MAPFDRPWLSIGPPVQIQLCLVPFLSYLTLNNIVTLISALEVTQLKVIQTGTIWKLGYSFLFAFHSSLTMAVSCIILEIKRDIGQKSWFFISPCVWCPRYGDSRRNIAIPFGMKKLEWWVYPMVKKVWRYDYPFRHNSRTWQTHRWTDRWTPHDGIGRAYA